MSRTIAHYRHALRVNYFQWPCYDSHEFDMDQVDYYPAEDVIEDIQETFISSFPEFERCEQWDEREINTILKGNNLEIGLSSYDDLSSLSVRISPSAYDYCDSDKEAQIMTVQAQAWLDANWGTIADHWKQYTKVGTFSNGEAIYEKIEKTENHENTNN